LIWVGTSKRTLLQFPEEVKRTAGYQLYLLQIGLNPNDWKTMTSIGSGVREIRIHSGGEYRIIYFTSFEEGIYILHTFHKKTQKTSKKDLDLAASRLRGAIKQRAEK
jgi:phage-related protein